jgi:hypothetical protein
MRTLGVAVLFIGCEMIAGCSRVTPDHEVHRRLLNAAGHAARDCGRARKDPAEYAMVTACAKDALNHRSPFVVQYQVAEVDVSGEQGIARNDQGQISEISYTTSGGANKFSTRTCSETELTVWPDGMMFGCPE